MTSKAQATEAAPGDGLDKPKVDGRRFVGLDGLRGYLALCVILVHTLGIFALGGATLDNEWNHLQQKLMRGLGVVAIENQARI